jgi:hypothetical protein
MAVDEFEEYYQAITQIEAREVLLKLKIADWAHMSKEDRKQWHRELHKMAKYEVNSKQMTLDELRGMLNG